VKASEEGVPEKAKREKQAALSRGLKAEFIFNSNVQILHRTGDEKMAGDLPTLLPFPRAAGPRETGGIVNRIDKKTNNEQGGDRIHP
jgi:hypothetical protein